MVLSKSWFVFVCCFFPLAETSADALLAMQQMMENLTLEVHITSKVDFSSGSVNKKDKDLSVWFSSLPSPIIGITEEPVSSQRENGDEAQGVGEEPDVEAEERSHSRASEKLRSTSESSGFFEHSGISTNGDSGFFKSFDLHTPVSSQGEPSPSYNCVDEEELIAEEQSSKEGEVPQKVTERAESIVGEQLEVSREVQESKECEKGSTVSASKNKSSNNGLASETPFESSSHSVMKDLVSDITPSVNCNHSSPDKHTLTVEDVEMGYDSKLPELAAFIPVVEIYTQLGSQVSASEIHIGM